MDPSIFTATINLLRRLSVSCRNSNDYSRIPFIWISRQTDSLCNCSSYIIGAHQLFSLPVTFHSHNRSSRVSISEFKQQKLIDHYLKFRTDKWSSTVPRKLMDVTSTAIFEAYFDSCTLILANNSRNTLRIRIT